MTILNYIIIINLKEFLPTECISVSALTGWYKTIKSDNCTPIVYRAKKPICPKTIKRRTTEYNKIKLM